LQPEESHRSVSDETRNRGTDSGGREADHDAAIETALDDLAAAGQNPQALADTIHKHAALLITPAALSRAQARLREASASGNQDRIARARIVLQCVEAAQGHTVEEVQRTEVGVGPSLEEVAPALNALLNARTWSETRQVLEAHQSLLLSETALDALRTVAHNMRAAGQSDSAANVEQHLQLLERARMVGVDAAFASEESELREEVDARTAAGAPGGLSKKDAEAVLAVTGNLEEGYTLTDQGKALRGQARVDTLRRAVAAFDVALPVLARVANRSYWALAQSGKGNALHELGSALTGLERAAALREAIACYDAAVAEFAREGRRDVWAATQLDRGSALRVLALNEQGPERAAILRDAIASFDAALTVFSPSPEARLSARLAPHGDGEIPLEEYPKLWAGTQLRKGIALRELARTLGGAERVRALRDAIACLDASLQVTRRETDEADWGSTLHYKGWALADLANELHSEERVVTLRAALQCYDAALAAQAAANPADWPATQNNKGSVLLALAGTMSSNEERAEALRAAIECHDAALAAYDRAADPAGWAATQHNKGIALQQLALLVARKGRTSTLRDALSSFDAALEERRQDVLPFDYAETQVMKATTLTYLASAVPDREERAANLREAIACCEAALLVFTHEDAPNFWAGTQVNKGGILASLADMLNGSDRLDTLQRAVACYDLALEVLSRESAPTHWATTQWNKGAALRDLVVAQLTQNGEAPSALLGQAIACYDAALQEYPRELQPAAHRQVAFNAGMLFLLTGNWARAVPYLETALDAVDDLYSISLTARGREEQLSAGGDLTAHLAYALVRAGGTHAAQWAAAALERGRARATGEAVQRQEEELRVAGQVDPELLTAFRAAADRLVAAGMQHAESGLAGEDTPILLALNQQYSGYDQAKAARTEYDMLLARIRAHPRLASFLRPMEALPAAVGALRANERLLYLACSPVGLVAVLVGAGAANGNDTPLSAMAFWDEQLNRDESERLAQTLLEAQEAPGEDGEHLDAALVEVTEALGRPDVALAQIARACGDNHVQHLIAIPCGLLGLMPLHATLVSGPNTDRLPLLDVVRISYTPSSRVWHASRQHVAEQRGGAPDALVVGNPLPLPAGVGSLPGAAREARQVATLIIEQAHGQVRSLMKTAATRAAVVDALRAGSMTLTHAHFACHGVAIPDDPDQSALILAQGEPLTVRDLLDPTPAVRFRHLRLAALSACQTGIPGTTLPDEVVGLPAGWLQAGAAGVLASLWPVSDAATVALMTRFYELHLLDQVGPVDALWLAQRWLRGLPSWRADYLTAGARRAADGPEAAEVVRALARTRGGAGAGDEEDAIVSDEIGDTGAAVSGAASSERQTWHAPRIWAAFAFYGD
jgi:CHAT domain-containing protein